MSERTPIEVAEELLKDPSIDKILVVLKEAAEGGRRHGERWAEIAIAHWLQESSFGPEITADTSLALATRAEMIRDRKWRRPEFESSTSLEAAAAEAEDIIARQKG